MTRSAEVHEVREGVYQVITMNGNHVHPSFFLCSYRDLESAKKAADDYVNPPKPVVKIVYKVTEKE